MNEQHTAARIRQALDHGLQDIPAATGRRLEAARHLALSRQKAEAPQLELASAGAHFSFGARHPYARHILSVLALLLGMWIALYWHSNRYLAEIEQVDSALLSDDLPPEAFLDTNFAAWLRAGSP